MRTSSTKTTTRTKSRTSSEAGPRVERLQKVLARAGVASRRAAEKLMREGRVQVNGRVVTQLGTKVDPAKDHVKVDGHRIRPPGQKVYYALFKPQRVVTTLSDPEGRRTVKDLLKGVHQRVYPIGRLDYETEGLLLLTNDGDLAARCMHPKHGVRKVYQVLVEGDFPDALLEKLEDGVFVDARPGQDARRTLPSRVKRLKLTRHPKQRTLLEIRLREGRNRQVRRMFARVGRDVVYLIRTAVGPVTLGDMRPGQLRPLTPAEIHELKKL
jgi:23S rRNA pseudouridine2605 synthase